MKSPDRPEPPLPPLPEIPKEIRNLHFLINQVLEFLTRLRPQLGFSIESYDYFVLTQKPRGVDDKTFKSWVYRYYKITFLYTFAPLTGNK